MTTDWIFQRDIKQVNFFFFENTFFLTPKLLKKGNDATVHAGLVKLTNKLE